MRVKIVLHKIFRNLSAGQSAQIIKTTMLKETDYTPRLDKQRSRHSFNLSFLSTDDETEENMSRRRLSIPEVADSPLKL